ncbi:hypothetical protein HPB48_013993 [Haemaphysalis longicornis]|uniref:Ig-like domain-containing protein n=1 Tax=Haemaphysalis longicornis TaxID=44386 RepID=A0A9J6G8D8_HAELO|nr:hypothetical protein HPB48_013993 [Haemaphysalis longicornis]
MTVDVTKRGTRSIVKTLALKIARNGLGSWEELLGWRLMWLPYTLFAGVPVPTVTWRRDGAELMHEIDSGSRDLDGVVRSSIVIDSLTRDDLLMELSCETSNLIGGPFEASVLVDLTRKSHLYHTSL